MWTLSLISHRSTVSERTFVLVPCELREIERILPTLAHLLVLIPVHPAYSLADAHSMPTFVILKSAQVADTVRGANPAALRAAVLKAANDACKSGPASSANFQTKGQTLGSSEAPTTSGGGPTLRSWIGGGGGSWADALLRMSGLYIETLFSTDPRAAAETSQWRVQGSARFDR